MLWITTRRWSWLWSSTLSITSKLKASRSMVFLESRAFSCGSRDMSSRIHSRSSLRRRRLGVKVNDFAQSWKDGRAFSALTSVFTSLNFNESERQSVLYVCDFPCWSIEIVWTMPSTLLTMNWRSPSCSRYDYCVHHWRSKASDITESSEIDEHSVLTYISSFFSRCANQDQTKKYTDIIRTAVDITSKHRDSIQKV